MTTQKFPNINFYAVDSSGVEINSNGSHNAEIQVSNDNVDSTQSDPNNSRGGVTALTWGVFPNKEILQPTIFDHDTFIVWSKEGNVLSSSDKSGTVVVVILVVMVIVAVVVEAAAVVVVEVVVLLVVSVVEVVVLDVVSSGGGW